MRHSIKTVILPRSLPLLLAVMSMTGCAFGHKFVYTDAVPRLDAPATSQLVAVSVHDQRKIVTSGRADPTFVGEVRSLYRIPYGAHTASGAALAEDLTKNLVSAFSYKGVTAVPVFTSHTDTPEAVVRKVASARAERGVVVTLVDWKSDSYFKTELFYDLRLKILGADAKVLAERQVAGHDKEISGTASNAFREKVELLLNHTDTIQALGPQATPPAAMPASTSPAPASTPAATPSTVTPVATKPSYWQVFSYGRGMTDRTALAGPHATVEACRATRNEVEKHYPDRVLVCESVSP